MSALLALTKRELQSYFRTPIAYVFMSIFVLLCGLLTFYVAHFFERNQADLQAFFQILPWVLMVFIPAISMRLWSEERKSGTIEFLLTLPVSVFQVVFSKFLAGFCFSLMCLLLTTPIWISVNYLGQPDNGVILAGYLGATLLIAGYLSFGLVFSTLAKNQIVAFVFGFMGCLLINLSGYDLVLDFFNQWLPNFLLEAIASFSFTTHFESMTKGLLETKSLLYFISLIALLLFVNTKLVSMKKAD